MQRDTECQVFGVMLALVLGLGIISSISACAPSSAAGVPQTTVVGTTPQKTATASGTQGTVKGVVVAAPACPVERADQPCPPKPVPNREVVIETPGGDIAARVTTDQNGRFTVILPPGIYVLKVPAGANAFPIQRNPQMITVIAGQTLQVQITLDSGIR